MDHPFYMWTLLEAWSWLTNLPVLGFIFLIIVGIILAVLVLFAFALLIVALNN